ncbi:MAG: hypothetical protein HY564_01355 [Candidatus Jacksonbacteria bacterium]|nr:hypothetical protein [Candidatus Jacksonbacteria bacterium]
MDMPAQSHPIKSSDKIRAELEKERDRINGILARRAKKDPNVSGNYVTSFPDTGSELDDNVFEEEEYEVNLAIEQSLEKRLKQIEEDLAKIATGTYSAQ